MKKNLQDKKKKLSKIQLELIFIRVSVNVLFFVVIFFVGWLCDKLIETGLLLISFFIFRLAFDKVLHMNTITKCIKLTLSVFTIAITTLMPKEISLIMPIVFGFIICFIASKVQEYLDATCKKKMKNKRQIIIDILGKDNLAEESIEEYCTKIGNPYLSESIYLFLNNKLEDTAEILGVDNTTITRRINKFIKASKELD